VQNQDHTNPETYFKLRTQDTINWMILRLLPEGHNQKHIATNDQAYRDDNSPIDHVVLVDVDFRKFINEVMLQSLGCIQDEVYQGC
jgi:hypothetical protein